MDIREILRDLTSKYDSLSIGPAKVPTKFIPTGCAAADYVMGTQGFPIGRIVEISGDVAVGKTSLAITTLAQLQKLDNSLGIFLDYENTLDPLLCKKIGLNIENIILAQPHSLEEGLNIIEDVIKNYTPDTGLIVVDSIASAPSNEELETPDKLLIGSKARIMSHFLRRIVNSLANSNFCLLFVNQIRQKIGILVPADAYTTPGGMAIPFHASIRLHLKKIQLIKRKGDVVGISVKIVCNKNKLNVPYRFATTDFLFDYGFNNTKFVADLLVEHKLAQRKGAYYQFEGKNYRAHELLEKVKELKEVPEECGYFLRTYMPQAIEDSEFSRTEPQEESES